ncbi:MAG: LON peptidase substrate-binding domain-containing protein [Verrucomicrobia bacterium]|nr:LON peptidase substrate-binding domain-containing protein [Verrucomicrobiota bacterium]
MIKIPQEVPVMALPNAVLFPHSLLPLHIFELRYRKMLAYSLDGERMFSVGLLRQGIEEAGQITDLHPIAGVGLIRACVGNDNGTSNLVLQGLARIRLVAWVQDEPFRIARIEVVESRVPHLIEADALSAKVKELCARIEQLGTPLPGNLMEQLKQIDDHDVLADVVAAAFINDTQHRQQLLEAQDVNERLRLLIQLLRGKPS